MTYAPDPEFDAWKGEAESMSIVDALARSTVGSGAKLHRSGRELIGPCPRCGFTDTFGINLQKNVFICRKGDAGGGPVALVMHLDGCTFLEAVETITGRPKPGRRRQESEQERQDRERRAAARRHEMEQRAKQQDEAARRAAARKSGSARALWAESVLLAGTPAESYLAGRGLEIGRIDCPDLRFAQSIHHGPSGRWFPALVALVRDANGRPCGIWRIFLGDGRKGRAPDEPNKMGLGQVGGGAVRIGGMGHTIGVAEGIESALAWAEINDWAFPVWALLSTSGMVSFDPPAGLRRVIVFPDFDLPRRARDGTWREPPGGAAAAKLIASLNSRGICCTSVERRPGPACDGVDILRKLKGLGAE